MNVTELCDARRETLLPRWVESFFASYLLDAGGFLRTARDPFANPVGQITRDAVATLYDAVAGHDAAGETVKNALESLMRLRAVQDMPPSRAVGALYLLKPLLRAEILPSLAGDAGDAGLPAYLEMESRLDGLALLALDMYQDSREKVFRLRVDELKRELAQVLRWARRSGAGTFSGEENALTDKPRIEE
jgi:hypothetical protein